MKSYKLIKEYPGSPKLGSIVETNRHGLLGFVEKTFAGIFPSKYPEYWEEIEDALFVTQDKVKIFDGKTTVYGVFTETAKCYDHMRFNLEEMPYDYFVNYGLRYWKLFSTKKAAERYIRHNKPVLSYNDIIDVYYSYDAIASSFEEELIKLVKEKIK